MAQQGSSRKRSVKESVHLDFLRKAMEWVVDQSIFRNLQTHGNTSWIAKDLVMLAVLWVWSEKSQLTAAFQEAVVWSKRLFGGVAVGSYQALTNALVRYGVHLRGLVSLTTLSLSDTRITGAGLEILSDLTNLQTLILSGCKNLTDDLKHLTGLRNLVTLSLFNCENITGAGVNSLNEKVPK